MHRKHLTGVFCPFLFSLGCAIVFCYHVECNTHSTEGNSPVISENPECENEFDPTFCAGVVEAGSCGDPDNDVRFGCRKSCGLCEEDNNDGYTDNQESYNYLTTDKDGFTMDDQTEDPLGKGGCEDKMPQCSNYVSQCCSMKEAMNASCAKTCKFCTESAAPPSAGIGVPAPTPTASSNQDPCDPTKPPSGTVDVPGQTTTTTQTPIGNLPSAATITLPGQTTTTTTQSPIGTVYPPIG